MGHHHATTQVNTKIRAIQCIQPKLIRSHSKNLYQTLQCNRKKQWLYVKPAIRMEGKNLVES